MYIIFMFTSQRDLMVCKGINNKNDDLRSGLNTDAHRFKRKKKSYSIMSSLTIYSLLKISHNLDLQTSEVSENQCNTDSKKVQ